MRSPLPAFYWTSNTDMHCLREAIASTSRRAYSHQIQRLRVTGNFALLAGVALRRRGVYIDRMSDFSADCAYPREAEDWAARETTLPG